MADMKELGEENIHRGKTMKLTGVVLSMEPWQLLEVALERNWGGVKTSESPDRCISGR